MVVYFSFLSFKMATFTPQCFMDTTSKIVLDRCVCVCMCLYVWCFMMNPFKVLYFSFGAQLWFHMILLVVLHMVHGHS